MDISKPNPRKSGLYKPSPPRLLKVKRITHISKNIRRLTLTGEQLKGYPTNIPAAHIKIFIPRPHQAVPELPKFGPNGIEWPPREDKPFTRTYSVRRYDPDNNELDIDFAMHGDEGPASAFALKAVEGDYLGVSSPGGPYPMLPTAKHYVFVGDLTALPAISALLESLPECAQGIVLLEVTDLEDIHHIQAPSGIEICWLQTGHEPSALEKLKNIALPISDTFFWFAGENDLVVDLRRYAKKQLDCHRSQIYAVPYWKRGFSEEGYHDERHHVMEQE